MGTNFKLPFQLSQGKVATTIDPNKIGNDRIQALVGTYPGERVMRSDYGVNLPAYLFTPDIIGSTNLISNEVTAQAAKWEPSITLLSVTPITTQSVEGISQVNVEFSISNDPTLTPAMIATVEVGGKVVSN